MIKYLKIKKLYGRFNYTLSFEERNVTILTGPNGYGKTTILKIINSIYNKSFDEILCMDFSELEFEIKDGTKFTIKNKKSGLEINQVFLNSRMLDTLKSVFRYIEVNGYEKIDDSIKNVLIDKIKCSLKRKSNIYDKRNRMIYEYIDEDLIESEIDLLEDRTLYELKEEDLFNYCVSYKNRSKDMKNEEFYKNLNLILKDFEKLSKSVGDIYFIKEQRLLRKSRITSNPLNNNNKDSVEVINTLCSRFKKIIDKTSNEYSAQSNKLDSTYPIRLFDMENGITEEEYKQKTEEIGKKFEKLNKYDISDMQNIDRRLRFKKEHSKALKVYFDDFDTKYRVYESLIRQLDLFVGIINDRLQFKKIKIDRQNGIKVIDDSNREIKLEYLSSGEKQEIVLFFELIFASKHNALILIDEPEISLHIAWQKRFMQDVIDIANEMDLKVIVATHSPQIIGKNRDVQIDLGELYAENK